MLAILIFSSKSVFPKKACKNNVQLRDLQTSSKCYLSLLKAKFYKISSPLLDNTAPSFVKNVALLNNLNWKKYFSLQK